MKFLLDENFPLQLHRSLLAGGYAAEHIIVLGHRGASDAALWTRLASEEMVFLTQDSEFEVVPADFRSPVIVSQVPQRLPIAERVQVRRRALERFVREDPAERLFTLLPTGEILVWEIREIEGGGRARTASRRI